MLARTLLLVALSTSINIIDLTSTPAVAPAWKVVRSQSGGAIGSWPASPATNPVIIRLNHCTLKEDRLLVEIDIYNGRSSEVGIPISLDSRLFQREDKFALNELLIDVGALGEGDGVYETIPGLEPLTLFGSPDVAGSMRRVSPREHVTLRLNLEMRKESKVPPQVRAHIAGSAVSFLADKDGFDEIRTWVPELVAISDDVRCSRK